MLAIGSVVTPPHGFRILPSCGLRVGLLAARISLIPLYGEGGDAVRGQAHDTFLEECGLRHLLFEAGSMWSCTGGLRKNKIFFNILAKHTFSQKR